MKNIFICFIGIDGSGKTTVAKKMVEVLLNYDIRSKYVWGGYSLVVLLPFVKMVRKAITRKHNPFTDYSQYHSRLKEFGKRKVLFKIYQHLLLFEYLIEIFIKIKIPLWLGRSIVSDRYIFDTATNIASNYDLSFEEYRRLIDNLLRLCPKPDIIYFVDTPEEIALKRKNDIPSLDYLRNRRKYYKRISENYDIVTLNGLSDLDYLVDFLRDSIETFL